MNKLLTLLLLIATGAFAQRQNFSGKVVADNASVANIFVINQATGDETKTDATGTFTIAVRTGDVLAIYGDPIDTREFEIKRKWFNEQPFIFEVKPKSTELKEVVVEGTKINTDAMGITTGDEKSYTPAQRRKKANKLATTNQGLSLSVDAMANKANGKSKIINENVRTEDRVIAMDNYKTMFTPEDMQADYGIPKDEFEAFGYFIVEDPDCLQALRANNARKTKAQLQRLSKLYLERSEDEK